MRLPPSYVLAAQQIRHAVEQGSITTPGNKERTSRKKEFNNQSLEDRIQPSSFEPILGDRIFILDTKEGQIAPNKDEQVYRTLLNMPKGKRQDHDITNGFRLDRSYSYLVKLEDKVNSSFVDKIEASPKSSYGRIFLRTRLLADYNPGMDEIDPAYKPNTDLDLWLLIQPLQFNVIVYPGMSLNQLRFTKGKGALLSPKEIIQRAKKAPFTYKSFDGNLIPTNPVVNKGIRLHLNLIGEDTEGVIGLKAMNNPIEIDLSKKGNYDPKKYFEPILANDEHTIVLSPGEYHLLSSLDVVDTHPDTNFFMEASNQVGFDGLLHLAGFFDPGFFGDPVYEIRSDELTPRTLHHGTPINELLVFRNPKTNKLYGEEIGSNYMKQNGPRPAKFFKAFDFTEAAKNYQKLNRSVLTIDAKTIQKHFPTFEGFAALTDNMKESLLREIENPIFHSRYDCEEDSLLHQVIPYVLVFGPNNTLFTYTRAQDLKDYGDKRLFKKLSFGLGGHITEEDGPDYLNTNIIRELNEEVRFSGRKTNPVLMGRLFKPKLEVDKVHLGLVYKIYTNGKITPIESSISQGGFEPIEEIMENPKGYEGYETWTQELIPLLPLLYKK